MQIMQRKNKSVAEARSCINKELLKQHMASAQAGPINSTESGPGLEMAGSRGSVGATNGMRGQVTDTMMKE